MHAGDNDRSADGSILWRFSFLEATFLVHALKAAHVYTKVPEGLQCLAIEVCSTPPNTAGSFVMCSWLHVLGRPEGQAVVICCNRARPGFPAHRLPCICLPPLDSRFPFPSSRLLTLKTGLWVSLQKGALGTILGEGSQFLELVCRIPALQIEGGLSNLRGC